MADMINGNKARMEPNIHLIPSAQEQEPPPAYSLHSSDLTAAFSNLTLKPADSNPTPDQCIAHLKLLEAFHQLREDVATTDGLFGINDSLTPADEADARRINILRQIREKRWAVYVTRAVMRFEKWWQMSIEPAAEMIQQKDLWRKFLPTVHGTENSWMMDRDHLPPLGKCGLSCPSMIASAQPVQMSSWFGIHIC